MKSKQFLAASIMMLMPLTIQAQGYIKRAFNVLTTSDPAKVESIHKLNKNPETGVKEGQLDVYEFTLPVSHHNLIEDIKLAFDQDKEKAYSMSSVSTTKKKLYNYTSLAVGGDDYGYPLGEIKDSRYIYALFLDPDDKSKTHRYAYAMEWHEGAKEIVGKLIITYAPTQQYRNSKKQIKRITVNDRDINIDDSSLSFGNGFPFDGSFHSAEQWLSEFNIYKNLFQKKSEGAAASQYVTNIYKLCKKADCLEEAEKKMVSKEIMKLKNKSNDDFIKELFDMSIERLKK